MGIDKYSSYSAAKDSRLFHVGTASGSYVDNRNASLSRTVIVTDATGIKDVIADKDLKDLRDAQSPAYNLSGQRVTSAQSGIIIQNGKKTLKP